jgi:hypothetical protein
MAGIGGDRADLQFLTVAHFQHWIERCVMKAEMNRVKTGREMLHHSSIHSVRSAVSLPGRC